MGDRFDGSLAGGGRAIVPHISVATGLHNLHLNETLVTKDESGSLVLFRAVQNPVNGGLMYVAEPAHPDSPSLYRAIKLSQMASMLSDHARCSKYADAISQTLNRHPRSCVLDIGTGTGLLAMLAARAGAEHVHAVEMFEPLANLATRIIQANDLNRLVTVHAAKSTDMSVVATTAATITPDNAHATTSDDDKDEVDGFAPRLQKRANVLVTEIFDSALLGEACLPVIAHARDHLLTPDATVIPAKATVYARVVHSNFLAKFHDLGADFPLHRASSSRMCKGGVTAVPMHLDALTEPDDYEYITDTFTVFDFDFMGKPIDQQSDRHHVRKIARTRNGIANAVVTWWELDLLGDGRVTYSTQSGVENWQDHWLQMVYPLPFDTNATSTESHIELTMSHTESTFHFARGVQTEPAACSCGYHALPGGPYRIQQLGDRARLQSLSTRIENAFANVRRTGMVHEASKIRCLDTSDSGVCATLASQCAVGFDVEISSSEDGDELSTFLYAQVARNVQTARARVDTEYEPLDAVLARESQEIADNANWKRFDMLLSEPYTHNMSQYPLATLGNFLVQRSAAAKVMSANFTCVPAFARIQAQLIRFADKTVQSSFKHVGNVLGFDHGHFNKLFTDVKGGGCAERISVPLFQYDVTKLSAKTCLHTVQFANFKERNIGRRRCARLRKNDKVQESGDALVFWVEYDDVEASRTQRYEMAWLSEEERQQIDQHSGVDIWFQWKDNEGYWKLGIETLSIRGGRISGIKA